MKKELFDEPARENEPEDPVLSDDVREIVSLDLESGAQETAELDEETTRDLLEDSLEERYFEEVAEQTADAGVQESFEERQKLERSPEKLDDSYHAKSATLSGGDVDAAWQDANVGEETVGGMAPTPDQDMVEEIGEAYGISYEDDEPLETGEKLAERDEHRWELNPESVDENQ